VTTTITNLPTGESTTAAEEMLRFRSSRPSSTVVHTIIGAAAPDLTLKPAGPRAGTFDLLCLNTAAAQEVDAFLRLSGPFTITGVGTPVAELTFVVGPGDVGVDLDGQTFTGKYVVTVAFTEVLT
jgi:hypothetical protein